MSSDNTTFEFGIEYVKFNDLLSNSSMFPLQIEPLRKFICHSRSDCKVEVIGKMNNGKFLGNVKL